jgi:hypothetical protein
MEEESLIKGQTLYLALGYKAEDDFSTPLHSITLA